MNLSERELERLWIGATRYHLGRMTYAVGEMCGMLVAHWNNIPQRARQVIRLDVEEEFTIDDKARQLGNPGFLPLGMDCDRKEWEKVRELWSAKE